MWTEVTGSPNPISEATQLVASGASRTVPLDEFVFGDNLQNPTVDAGQIRRWELPSAVQRHG